MRNFILGAVTLLPLAACHVEDMATDRILVRQVLVVQQPPEVDGAAGTAIAPGVLDLYNEGVTYHFASRSYS